MAEVTRQWEEAKASFDKGHAGNSSTSFSEVFKFIRKAGLEYPHLVAEYLSKYSPAFAKAYNHETTHLFDSYALGGAV